MYKIRNLIRWMRANLSAPFNNNEKFYNKKDEKNLNKIIKIAKDIFDDNKKKLTTHKIFSQKILDIILRRKLLNFLQLGFIQQMFFIHNRLFIVRELFNLIIDKNWKFWKKLIKENDIGNPVRFFLYPHTSGNKIHQVYHLKKFIDFSNNDLKKYKNIFEFGGGYGNMASIFNKINPSANYIIFDTFEVSLLQYYYLKKCNLNVEFGINNKNRIKLIHKLNDLKKIVNKINKSDKNLFIANWSISEVPIKFRKKLLFIFKKFHYQIFSFQKNFEKINNLKYFNNINLENKSKKLNSNIFEMKGKKNNFYLFCSK